MENNKPVDLFTGGPNHALIPTEAVSHFTTTLLSNPTLSSRSLFYQAPAGPPRLRIALARWLERSYELPFLSSPSSNDSAPKEPKSATQGSILPPGIDTTTRLDPRAARICITGGASQGLAALLAQFTDPAITCAIWVVAPCYHQTCQIIAKAGFFGTRLRGVPEDGEGLNLEFLEREMKACERKFEKKEGNVMEWRPPGTKAYRHVVCCVPSFSNPSGKLMSVKRREELVRLARKFDALLVADDVYDFLRWQSGYSRTTVPLGPPPPRLVDIDATLPGQAADGFGNAVSNGSFSKLVGPGVRTGWIEGVSEKMAEGAAGYGAAQSGGCPSSFVAEVLAGMVESGVVEKHVQWLVAQMKERWRRVRSAVERELLPLGVEIKGGVEGKGVSKRSGIAGGYFIWLRLPGGLDAAAVAERAKVEDGVFVAPGGYYEVWGDNTREGLMFRDHVRLCFVWDDEDRLEVGVKRLARTLRRILKEGM
ncbi:MAG: hypothetical protein Q9227_004977 [Pyrenula ochraceoflavens]